jgi:type II secretion system protein H
MNPRRHARGFTLIEVMAVIVITAIVTTAVVVSLAGASRAGTVDDVIRRLSLADRQLRLGARRSSKPIALRFDAGDGRVVRETSDGDSKALLDLPGDVELAGVRTRDGVVDRITFAVTGATPTYAVELRPRGGRPRWVVVAGLTGDVTEASDEKGVDAIFALVASIPAPSRPSRDDAR